MCGITGIISNKSPISKELLVSMCDVIQHRGPDDFGTYLNGNIGLGHRRLSIIDLTPTGHQPMFSDNKKLVMVYNGEVYNYNDIKKELLDLGYSFKGSSDTETIIKGYQEWGIQIFQKLNGIFSIAIWDKNNGELILARDRFGVKPLYYYHQENSFVFGSELKSFFKSGIKPSLDYKSLHEFLFYGYALGEQTMVRNIKKLLPGNILRFNFQSFSKKIFPFWKHEDLLPEKHEISEKEAINKVKELLELSVKRQLLSDVPVGIFLSGGIDSSAITAFATKHYGKKISTFSAGFDFSFHNELPLARKVASTFKTDHHELMIKGAELPEIIEKMVYHHDEPFSDSANIPLYLLTQKAQETHKVILQGDGGDEIFAGYSRYHILKKYEYYKWGLILSKPFRNLIPNKKIRDQITRFYPILTENKPGKLFAKLLTSETEELSPARVLSPNFYKKISDFNPYQYYYDLGDRFKNLKGKPQQLLWIDTMVILPNQFLEKVDKSTMASSVEVRVPFLDNDLTDYVMRLPGDLKVKKGIKKYILKKALEGIVPNEVLQSPKKGFGVPAFNWIKGPLNDYMKSRLFSNFMIQTRMFNYDIINKLIEEHQTGKVNNGFILWKLLNLSIWLEKYKIELD